MISGTNVQATGVATTDGYDIIFCLDARIMLLSPTEWNRAGRKDTSTSIGQINRIRW